MARLGPEPLRDLESGPSSRQRSMTTQTRSARRCRRLAARARSTMNAWLSLSPPTSAPGTWNGSRLPIDDDRGERHDHADPEPAEASAGQVQPAGARPTTSTPGGGVNRKSRADPVADCARCSRIRARSSARAGRAASCAAIRPSANPSRNSRKSPSSRRGSRRLQCEPLGRAAIADVESASAGRPRPSEALPACLQCVSAALRIVTCSRSMS